MGALWDCFSSTARLWFLFELRKNSKHLFDMTLEFTYQAVGESSKMPVSNFSGYFPHRLAQMMAHRVKPLSGPNANKQFNCGRDKWKLDFLHGTICSAEKSASKSWRIKETAEPLVNLAPIRFFQKPTQKTQHINPAISCYLTMLTFEIELSSKRCSSHISSIPRQYNEALHHTLSFPSR